MALRNVAFRKPPEVQQPDDGDYDARGDDDAGQSTPPSVGAPPQRSDDDPSAMLNSLIYGGALPPPANGGPPHDAAASPGVRNEMPPHFGTETRALPASAVISQNTRNLALSIPDVIFRREQVLAIMRQFRHPRGEGTARNRQWDVALAVFRGLAVAGTEWRSTQSNATPYFADTNQAESAAVDSVKDPVAPASLVTNGVVGPRDIQTIQLTLLSSITDALRFAARHERRWQEGAQRGTLTGASRGAHHDRLHESSAIAALSAPVVISLEASLPVHPVVLSKVTGALADYGGWRECLLWLQAASSVWSERGKSDVAAPAEGVSDADSGVSLPGMTEGGGPRPGLYINAMRALLHAMLPNRYQGALVEELDVPFHTPRVIRDVHAWHTIVNGKQWESSLEPIRRVASLRPDEEPSGYLPRSYLPWVTTNTLQQPFDVQCHFLLLGTRLLMHYLTLAMGVAEARNDNLSPLTPPLAARAEPGIAVEEHKNVDLPTTTERPNDDEASTAARSGEEQAYRPSGAAAVVSLADLLLQVACVTVSDVTTDVAKAHYLGVKGDVEDAAARRTQVKHLWEVDLLPAEAARDTAADMHRYQTVNGPHMAVVDDVLQTLERIVGSCGGDEVATPAVKNDGDSHEHSGVHGIDNDTNAVQQRSDTAESALVAMGRQLQAILLEDAVPLIAGGRQLLQVGMQRGDLSLTQRVVALQLRVKLLRRIVAMYRNHFASSANTTLSPSPNGATLIPPPWVDALGAFAKTLRPIQHGFHSGINDRFRGVTAAAMAVAALRHAGNAALALTVAVQACDVWQQQCSGLPRSTRSSDAAEVDPLPPTSPAMLAALLHEIRHHRTSSPSATSAEVKSEEATGVSTVALSAILRSWSSLLMSPGRATSGSAAARNNTFNSFRIRYRLSAKDAMSLRLGLDKLAAAVMQCWLSRPLTEPHSDEYAIAAADVASNASAVLATADTAAASCHRRGVMFSRHVLGIDFGYASVCQADSGGNIAALVASRRRLIAIAVLALSQAGQHVELISAVHGLRKAADDHIRSSPDDPRLPKVHRSVVRAHAIARVLSSWTIPPLVDACVVEKKWRLALSVVAEAVIGMSNLGDSAGHSEVTVSPAGRRKEWLLLGDRRERLSLAYGRALNCAIKEGYQPPVVHGSRHGGDLFDAFVHRLLSGKPRSP